MIKIYKTFSLIIESSRVVGYNFYSKKTIFGIPYKITDEDLPISDSIERLLDEVVYYDENGNLIVEIDDNNITNKTVGFKK